MLKSNLPVLHKYGILKNRCTRSRLQQAIIRTETGNIGIKEGCFARSSRLLWLLFETELVVSETALELILTDKSRINSVVHLHLKQLMN